jgi:hypothetical protein
MKIFKIFILIFFFSVVFINESGSSAFLSIDKIDAATEFPLIKTQIKIDHLNRFKNKTVNEESITVFEDGYKVDFSISEIKDQIKHVLILFSFKKDRKIKNLLPAKETARLLVETSGEMDKLTFYLTAKAANFSSDKSIILRDFDTAEYSDENYLFNSIYESAELLKNIQSFDKKLIVFTDGADDGSSIDDDDIVKFCKEHSIQINFVLISPSSNKKKLDRISKLTSGSSYIYKQKKIQDINYKQILLADKGKYLIKHRSILKQDGIKHQLEIRIRNGDLSDRELLDFSLNKKDEEFNFFYKGGLLMAAIVLVLIVVLALTVIYFIKRENSALVKIYKSEYKKSALETYYDKYDEKDKYSKMIDLEDSERRREVEILKESDPEYSYAAAWLIEKSGPEAGKKFPLYWDEIIIGRSRECSLVVEDDSVSLNHAKIRKIKESYYIFDLASDNGTCLNDKKLLRPKALFDWDEIKIGRIEFLFRGSNIKI